MTLIILGCVIGLITNYFKYQNWLYRFEEELDQFFGEGNWEYIDKETKESMVYKEYFRGTRRLPPSERPGKFNNWYISFTNKDGEKVEWYISNHLYKINKDKHDIFSSKRLSSKQAFYIELMDIALYTASKEIFHEFIKNELTENEAASLDISIHERGRLNREFLNSLMKEQWFTINNVTAEDFLTNDLQEFNILIRGHDYKVDKLTAQERQNVLNALHRIEKRLIEKYGEHASFEIIFDGERLVEYKDGKKE